MILRLYCTFLLPALFLSGCNQNTKEQEIVAREKAVERREERMVLLEDDYRALVEMRDSLKARSSVEADTALTFNDWPDSVQGDWSSRMVCRSSRCANYVIGDQRNELWRFYSDSTGSYVQVVNNNEYTRVFSGRYHGQKITLNVLRDSTINNKSAMQVELDDLGSDIMKGSLVITGQNNCKAVFSVELTPRER